MTTMTKMRRMVMVRRRRIKCNGRDLAVQHSLKAIRLRLPQEYISHHHHHYHHLALANLRSAAYLDCRVVTNWPSVQPRRRKLLSLNAFGALLGGKVTFPSVHFVPFKKNSHLQE